MLLRQLYFSFPVRLLALHFRNHLVLIGVWVLLALFSTGQAGRFFGMHYLLLTPEYRGAVDFWSFFITGMSFGAFVMIWHLTTYLLISNRFPFLASLEAPFTKFCINNSLIPLVFFVIWMAASTWFQWHDELTRSADIFSNLSGFVAGMILFISLLAAYLYFTNKDIVTFLRPRKFVPKPGGRILAPGMRMPTIWEIKSGFTRWRVDTYLTERARVRLVRSVAHYNQDLLEAVFRQNHWNAIVIQVIALVLLMLMGWYMDSEWVRLPTAATIFLLGSMVMSLFGAITFWFRQWGTLVVVALALVVNFITGMGFFNDRNKAYGLDYNSGLCPKYTYDSLQTFCNTAQMEADKKATLAILEKWLEKNRSPENPKPKLVFVCVSGGGLRSALWTMQTLQRADEQLNGQLLRQTMLITGASGGMLGAGYLRELYLRQQSGMDIRATDSMYIQDMGKDLLNPVTFAILSNDIFLPLADFRSGHFRYSKDRGYLFERQLNDNCRGFLHRRLADYQEAEAQARIPMMILSPFILNDARRLLISPQGVSYLMRPPGGDRLFDQAEVDGVDFRRLFWRQQADSLAFTNALRMNCTFPYILPNVWMPTQPSLEIMDAGLRDNYGLSLAIRFAQVFRTWIRENTGGIVLLQIRSWEKVDDIAKNDSKGVIGNLLSPAAAATNLTSLQDFEQDNTLNMLCDLLGPDKVESIRFTYRPVRKNREASLSLHLSKREKIDIREAFYSPANQVHLRRLLQTLRY